ncbi:hypothetical protein F5884DRAFT_874470 [Xylogone sp. PMI_703]|nr:hypothetical protein F5884DRAFT_874470 [Xylogone sp. PMI_703]
MPLSTMPITEDDVLNDMAVVQMHVGDGDGADVVFECNSKRISVSIFPSRSSRDCNESNPKQATEDHLIDLLRQSIDDSDNYDDIMEEISDIILDVGRPLFIQTMQIPTGNSSNQVLHSLLYPQVFHFRLQTINNKQIIIPIDSSESYTDSEAFFPSDIDANFQIDINLPQYSSMEIHILHKFLRSGAVSRVLVNGQGMLCTARRTGLLDPNLKRELDGLQRIKNASQSDSTPIRVPELLGYVKHAENGQIIGLLRRWIPSGLRDLRNSDAFGISKERRQKWADQICQTVNQLHRIGVVWGDGKISNVVISDDDDDDAWLIDFGGGWTEGWVDERLADTVEGNEQAVRNIAKFLCID